MVTVMTCLVIFLPVEHKKQCCNLFMEGNSYCKIVLYTFIFIAKVGNFCVENMLNVGKTNLVLLPW